MLLYIQTWLPLLTIALTAAICFSVTSFIMKLSAYPPESFHSDNRSRAGSRRDCDNISVEVSVSERQLVISKHTILFY